MSNRFDNVSIEDLALRESEADAELQATREALSARLVKNCPVKTGMIYSFHPTLVDAFGKPSYLRGRRILVAYINAAKPRWRDDGWGVSIQGFLSNPKSTTGDGFNRKVYVMSGWDRIDLDSAKPGPRPNYNETFTYILEN